MAIAVLALLIIMIFLIRRSRKRTSDYQTSMVGHLGNHRSFLDSKSELPTSSQRKDPASHAARSRSSEELRKATAELQGADIVQARESEERDEQELATQREQQEMALVPQAHEMPSNGETNELTAIQETQVPGIPPPVPLASKPRYLGS